MFQKKLIEVYPGLDVHYVKVGTVVRLNWMVGSNVNGSRLVVHTRWPLLALLSIFTGKLVVVVLPANLSSSIISILGC